jgi:capsular exopolysaccharide synthesis family protein
MAVVDINQKTEFQPVDQSNAFDLKRILFRAQHHWYFLVASMLICLSIAYYNIRYAHPVYPVSASIIIREKEETSGAELLYENALINQDRNYLNEPYILRSYTLIQRTVEELNFMVIFYLDGRVISSEVYNTLPLSVSFKSISDNPTTTFYFTILSPRKFSLEIENSNGNEIRVFEFDKLFTFGDNDIEVKLDSSKDLTEWIGKKYRMSFNKSIDIAKVYVSKLKVEWAMKGAGVMDLSLTGSNADKEIDFINGLIRNYQQLDLEKKNLTANRTVSFIKDQLVDISDSLKVFEAQLQQFKKSNRTTGDLSVDAQRIFTRIETLEVQRAELIVKNNYFDYLKKYLSESKNLDQIILPSYLGIADPVLGSLLGKIVDLQLELKLYLETERPTNPLVTNRLQRLNELKRDVLEAIDGLQSTDKIKNDFLNKQISDAEKQIGYLPLAQRQYLSIQRNFSLLENLYIYLMQKKSEAEISKASATTDIEVVNQPMAGGTIYPKPTQSYTLAVLLGLAMPLLVFFAMEYLNVRIQSKEDIDKLTSIPFIGGIGHKRSGSNLTILESPKSMIAESFRAVRSNLSYFIKKENSIVILVSSSISGEGKTFVTINLATVIAFSEKKTLIVGADLRRPKLFEDFQLSNAKGLSSYLAGLNDFEEIIQKTTIENLDLVSAGPVPPNPSELILRSQMEDFFNIARERYDFIIIDSPPLAVVSDAFLLNQYSDHLLFVTRQNYTDKDFLKPINDFYINGRIKNICIVLNDIHKSGPGYGYGYNSNYGYGYLYGSKKNGYGYYDEKS